jgi:hypothetical protein
MAKKPAKPAAKKPAPKKPVAARAATKGAVVQKKPAAKKPAPDWVGQLRSGADGLKKWNRLTRKEREAVKLAKADLSGCALVGAKLSDVKADGANLSGADLTGAAVTGSFEKAKFASANLTEAVMNGIIAGGSDFTGAKLIRADLRNAGLTRCTFAGADLTGANLTEGFLQGADLSTATLADVVWLGARYDQDTKWPPGFAVPGELRWLGRGTDPRLAGKGKSAAAHDVNGLMARLHKNIDEKRMKRTLDMLKSGKHQIFSDVDPAMVRGIVRSQKEENLYYSCVFCADGSYSCCTPDVAQCMGLSNEPCKHLLVLLIGLTRAGKIDPTTADKWVVAAHGKNPRWNKTVQNHMADTLLKYKGAQAGEIDWRPTETIPEDYYAM